MSFPSGSVGKESVCNAGDPGLIPGSGRSPGEGNSYPLQCPCLGDPMDREACGLQSMESQRVRYSWATNTFIIVLKSESESHSVVSDSVIPWTIKSMEFSRPEYWSDSLFFLQGIFPTQGSNPGLPHCRWILYQLSHKGKPRILEWVTYPFSRGSSQSRNWTCIEGRFFTKWAVREAHNCSS